MKKETVFKRFKKEIVELSQALEALHEEIDIEQKNALIYACLCVQQARKLVQDLRREEP